MKRITRCRLCGSRRLESVPGKVRDKPGLKVKRCQACGLVFLDSFDHIPENYYSQDYTDAHHSDRSWQEFLNKCRADDQRRAKDLEPIVANKSYLDVGCGAGGVLVELKGRCRRAAGVELQRRWRQCLGEASIEVHERLEQVDGTFDVISLFHVLEHIKAPVPFLRSLSRMLNPGGQLIIEVPSCDDALLTLYKSKPFSEFTYWSPHLFLYNRRTMGAILAKAGLRVNYVRQLQRYSLANHLRWLACEVPGGHIDWSFLDSPELTRAYGEKLSELGLTDTILASAGTGR